MITAPATLPDNLLEADFQRTVIDLAMRCGWRVSHQRPSQVRPGRYATATTGHAGAPDLLLAKGGRLICAELKRNRGRLGPGQPDWAIAIGPTHYRLWRPRDWAQILEELSA